MTSLFVTIQTIGGMLGPFIGAPLLAGTSNPFGLRDNYHGEPGGKQLSSESLRETWLAFLYDSFQA